MTLNVASYVSGKIHMQRFGKSYHLSWLELGLDEKFEWEDARNYCRRFCMDSITFDSPREYKFFKNLIKKGKEMKYLYSLSNNSNCLTIIKLITIKAGV